MQVGTVAGRRRGGRRCLARLCGAARIGLGMLARLFITAALFLGLDFLQLGKLCGAARFGRAQRLCRCLDCRLCCPSLCGYGAHIIGSGLDRCLGGIPCQCIGLGPFHPFLKGANTGGTLLGGEPVLGACLRCRLGRCLRRSRNRFCLLGRGTMGRGRRTLAAHLDLNGPPAGTAGRCPQLSGLETAECQPVAREAELLGFATIVAHYEPFPDNGRKPPPLPMCAR